MASVHRELSEKQSLAFSMTFLPTKLEFTTASAESTFVFEFTSPDARSNFEQAFEEAKKKLGHWISFIMRHIIIVFSVANKQDTRNREEWFWHRGHFLFLNGLTFHVFFFLAMNKDQWDPEFLKAIPIMKTRSGMQVSGQGYLLQSVYVWRRKSWSVFREVSSNHILLLVCSFHVPLPATAVLTAAVKCGCVTVMDTWARWG